MSRLKAVEVRSPRRFRSRRAGGVWSHLASYVSAGWLSIAPLYLFSVPNLPEPWAAFLLSTLVGVAGAMLAAVASVVPVAGGGSAAGYRFDAAAAAELAYVPGSTGICVAPPPDRHLPPVDLSFYESVGAHEVQCIRCGGFDVAEDRIDSRTIHMTCRTCSQAWPVSADAPPPDVIVRSWLHP